MYIRNGEAGADYDLPANYGGTALQESPPKGSPLSANAAAETADIPPPPPTPRQSEVERPLLSRLFGGGILRGGELVNSDLLLIMIALLIYGEDGESAAPLLILALLFFAK